MIPDVIAISLSDMQGVVPMLRRNKL